MKIFSDEERRGLMVLLPLILITVSLAVIAKRRDDKPLLLGDAATARFHKRTAADSTPAALTPFDPNEAGYEDLRRSGLPPEIAAGIVRWRRYGKVYRIEEDLALVTGMNDSIYAGIKPYIVISEKYAAAPRDKASTAGRTGVSNRHGHEEERANGRDATRGRIEPEPFAIDTASAAYLTALGFSPRQAEVMIRYREASGGIRTPEQFRRCYAVSDEMAERLLPYIIFDERGPQPEPPAASEAGSGSASGKPVEINSADSAALRSVRGIGERSVTEIMRYRELLGGYHSVEQIAELPCVTESNYEKILQQIYCDSCKITKIDINFADPKELARHPYVSAKALRKIVKQRKLKGGWSGIEEMTEDNIFTEEEAERLAPYLRFVPRAD